MQKYKICNNNFHLKPLKLTHTKRKRDKLFSFECTVNIIFLTSHNYCTGYIQIRSIVKLHFLIIKVKIPVHSKTLKTL